MELLDLLLLGDATGAVAGRRSYPIEVGTVLRVFASLT